MDQRTLRSKILHKTTALKTRLLRLYLSTLSAKAVTYFPYYRLNVPNQMQTMFLVSFSLRDNPLEAFVFYQYNILDVAA